MRIRRSLPAFGCALPFGAAPLHAQGYIGGSVLDSATATPLACLEVSLVDTAGNMVARQLTNGEGMFQPDTLANFVIDSTGRVVPSTIQVVKSSHRDFTEVVRNFLETVELEPARLAHRPVCALAWDWPFRFTIAPSPRAAYVWRSTTHPRPPYR